MSSYSFRLMICMMLFIVMCGFGCGVVFGLGIVM